MKHFIILLLAGCSAYIVQCAVPNYGAIPLVPSAYTRSRIVREIGAPNKLNEIELRIKSLCENSQELENELESTKDCIRAKKIFVTLKEEYIQHIDECSKTFRKTLKSCLKDKKYEYIPDFFFELIESMVRFLYDDLGIITTALAPCMAKLEDQESVDVYENCIKREQLTIDANILESKAKFCGKFLKISECYVAQLNATCTETEDLKKFRINYMKSMERPCE